MSLYNRFVNRRITKCPVSSKAPLKLPEYQLNYKSFLVDNTTTVLLPSRYEPIINKETGMVCYLGAGGYGVVFLAFDLQNKKQVAIKKVTDVFEKVPYRMLREIKILKHLQGHNNIVKLIDLYLPGKCLDDMNDLYIVLELVEGGSLHEAMKNFCTVEDNHVGGITIEEIKDIMCQILSAFYYLESAGIIHRDLKPENILVDLKENKQVKLSDFGLSTKEAEEVTNPESLFVVTRHYRPPEVILQYGVQNSSIDSWSLGCVFAELLYLLPPNPKRRRLFPLTDRHGTDEHLKLMIDILGMPDLNDVKGSTSGINYFKKLSNKHQSTSEDFTKKFTNAPEEAIDLLKRFLTWNPEKRITFEQALNHPFLSGNKNINLLKHDRKIDLESVVNNSKDILYTKYLFYKEVIGWTENSRGWWFWLQLILQIVVVLIFITILSVLFK
ncbi:hypothetical protein ABK040_006964 [Willaertia magna]